MANINIGFNELKSEPESWPFSHEWFVGKHSQKCENPKTTDIRLIWLPHNLIMCRLIRFAHKHTYAHWTYSVQMDVSCWSNTHTHMKCLHTHTNINEVRETKLKWAKIQSFEITLGKINSGSRPFNHFWIWQHALWWRTTHTIFDTYIKSKRTTKFTFNNP